MEENKKFAGNFSIVSDVIVRDFGAETAIVLGKMRSMYDHYKKTNSLNKYGEFFFKADSIEKIWGFKRYKRDAILDKLRNAGFITITRRGETAMNYFKIHEEIIEEYIKNAEEKDTLAEQSVENQQSEIEQSVENQQSEIEQSVENQQTEPIQSVENQQTYNTNNIYNTNIKYNNTNISTVSSFDKQKHDYSSVNFVDTTLPIMLTRLYMKKDNHCMPYDDCLRLIKRFLSLRPYYATDEYKLSAETLQRAVNGIENFMQYAEKYDYELHTEDFVLLMDRFFESKSNSAKHSAYSLNQFFNPNMLLGLYGDVFGIREFSWKGNGEIIDVVNS